VSNQVTLFQQETNAAVDPRMQALAKSGVGMDLGEGIKGSYGIVGIKGSKFHLKYKGVDTVLQNSDGTACGYVDVVIVKANAFLNKQYFEGNYVEGVNAAPVCYSLDGKTPSDASTKKQAASCALCPKNQFGSKIGDNGSKQKACRDTKKLAVVPLADIRNATMGGAMLFRVPPSALKDLSVMADALKGRGYPYNAVAVRIGFDLQAAHPKPTFKALRPLVGDEIDAVLEMFDSDSVQRVLADNDVAVEAEGEPAAPVQPAGMPAKPVREVSPFPSPEECAPVPQAPAQPPVMPPSLAEIAAQMQAGGTVAMVQPATKGAFAMPPNADPTPRVLRVKPDVEAPAPAPAATAVNPFAAPAAPAAPPPAAPAQQANPFAPPPSVKAPAKRAKPVAPVTVDVQATEVPAEAPSQLKTDIEDIVKGLGL
jgi:hypothetical protein